MVPVAIARSIATVHSTHAATASGCGCVSSDIAAAAMTSCSSSPRWTRATGPVRISEPLPAASG